MVLSKQKKRMVFYFHAPSGVLFGFTVVQIITEWGNTHFISIFLQKNLHGKFAPKTAKNLDFLEVFCGYIFFIASLWRRERDSNPRVIAHKLISSQPRYDRFDISPY